MKYTIDDFARLIYHTNLHADASNEDMKKLCDEAKKYHFKIVAINQVQSKFCSEQLKNTDIDTEDAIKNGANEINYVINITELKKTRIMLILKKK